MSSFVLDALRGQIRFLWQKPFVKNVFTLQVGSVFARGFGIIKSIIFARLLGVEGFGLYAVALSFIATFGFFTSLGQDQALIIYLAEEYGRGDRQKIQVVLKYFLRMTFLTVFIVLLMMALSPWLASIFYDEQASVIGRMAIVGFLTVLVSLPNPLVVSLLQITGEVRRMTVLENLDLVLQLCLGIGFVLLGFGPLGALLGLLGSNLAMAIVYWFLFFRMQRRHGLPGLWESERAPGAISPYVTQGLWIAVDKNVSNFFPDGLMFLLGLFAAPATVGFAKLALSLSDLPGGLLLGHAVRMTQTAIPALVQRGTAYVRAQCALLIKHTLLFHALLVFGGMVAFPAAVIVAYGWPYAAVIVPMWWLLLIRLLQPFNVANVSLLRLFRKVHVATLWNAVRIPVELIIFLLLLQSGSLVAPLTALVLIVLLHQLGGLLESVYVYGVLLRTRLAS